MIWNKTSSEDGEGDTITSQTSAIDASPLPLSQFVEAMVQAVPDAFIILDSNAYIIGCNEPACHFAGADMQGQHLSQHIRAPQVLEAVNKAIAGAQPETVSYERRVGGGRLYDVLITPITMGDSADMPKSAPSVSMLLRDLSAQQNLERMRADFVANASHELRTPLASMTGYVETLLGSARDDEKAREKFLGRMLEQAHRMRRLIDDLLSLSRVEMQLHQVPSEQVNMTEVAQYCVELLGLAAKENDCEIRLKARGKMLVAGQRDQLIQVCQNLIENAIRYGSSDKGIDVSVSHNKERGRIEFAVRDYGIGIEQADIPRLTERFYRVNIQESRSGGGTGLGLAIVKHIVLRHLGQLDVESSPGAGSTFTISLPEMSVDN